MPTTDSDTDGRIDTGDNRPDERVVCPACKETLTVTDECEHCGHDLSRDTGGIARSYAGP